MSAPHSNDARATARRMRLWQTGGALVLTVVAVVLAAACSVYSQALSLVEAVDVESVVVASMSDASASSSVAPVALRAQSDLTGYTSGGYRDPELHLDAQIGGDSDPAHRSVTFVLGGVVAKAVDTCDSARKAVSFGKLTPGQQTGVLLSIEDQWMRVEQSRRVADSDLRTTRFRELANAMTYVVVTPSAHPEAHWDQALPDDLRVRPIESAATPPGATQSFGGTRWTATCQLSAAIGREAFPWGTRLELPSIGIAVPLRWAGSTAEDGSIPQTPVEATSSLTWQLTTDLDVESIAESRDRTNILRSETEQGERLQSTAVLTPTSDARLGQGARSQVAGDLAYLSSARFSLRFSTDFYRTTREIALFLSGLLAGLAATMLLSVMKTWVQHWLERGHES